MLTDEQLIERVRHALRSETAEIRPTEGLLARVHDDLRDTRPNGNPAWPMPALGGAVAVFGAALAIAVAVVAVVLLGHHHPAIHSKGTVAPGTAAFAEAPDPQAGPPWALSVVRASSSQMCLQVGRLLPARAGRRPFASDPNLRHCATTDANGHGFLNVFTREVPAGVGPGPPSATCQLGAGGRRAPFCRLTAYRNLAYGLLGPDAIAITYSVNGDSITRRTVGPDGAYLVALPATRESCFLLQRGGRSCEGGSGETSTASLQSGVITAVTYRDGHVCRLPAPTSAGAPAGSCPIVGYAAPKTPPFRPPHITAAQVAAPVSVVTFPPTRRLCYRTYPEQTIPCDHGIPSGYKLAYTNPSREVLVMISFTARLAATNQHSVYEWAVSFNPDNPNCPGAGGGMSATTMTPIRAGQHIVLRTAAAPCRGRYTGLVSYQPNGWPGHDTLGARSDFTAAPRDGSTVVGRFSFIVP